MIEDATREQFSDEALYNIYEDSMDILNTVAPFIPGAQSGKHFSEGDIGKGIASFAIDYALTISGVKLIASAKQGLNPGLIKIGIAKTGSF